VPARFLCSLEPPLWPADEPLWRLALLADSVSAPYGALVRAGLAPGDLLLVIGGGVRAAAATAIARAKGAKTIVVDEDSRAQDRALSLGALAVLSAKLSDEELHEKIAEMVKDKALPDYGWKVVETSGSENNRLRAMRLVPDGGTGLLLDQPVRSIPNSSTRLPSPDWDLLIRKEAQVIACGPCHPDLLAELCALVVRGELPLSSLAVPVEPGAHGPHLGAQSPFTLPIIAIPGDTP